MLVAEYKGSRIVSTDLTDEQWDDIYRRSRDKATSPIHNPYNGLPMHCAHRHVINGLRWFTLFSGDGSNDSSGSETTQHMNLKLEICRAARALGYRAEIEWAAPDRSWVADVMIWRPGRRPLAVEVQWSPQVDPQYKDRSDRYDRAGIDCIWLDHRIKPKGNEVSRRDLLCRYDIPDEQNWVGLRTIDGTIHLPVNQGMQVRYDGAWHTASAMTKDLLNGTLSLHEHYKARHLYVYEHECWKCRKRICVWLVTTPTMYDEGHRVEEDYEQQVKDWASVVQNECTPCRIADEWSNLTQSTYRAFLCPFCNSLQEDANIIRTWKPTASVYLADYSQDTVKLFHSDLPDGEHPLSFRAEGKPYPHFAKHFSEQDADLQQTGLEDTTQPQILTSKRQANNPWDEDVEPLSQTSWGDAYYSTHDHDVVQKEDVGARLHEAWNNLDLQKITIDESGCLKQTDSDLLICPLVNTGAMTESEISEMIKSRGDKPYQMIMFDAGTDWPHVERDDWKLYKTSEPPTWSGIIQPDKKLYRLPINPYDLTIRYDGDWHSMEDCLTDILNRKLTIHEHPSKPGGDRMLRILHTDRIPHDTHKAYDMPPVDCHSVYNAHPTNRNSPTCQKEHTLKQLGMRSCFPSEPVSRRKIHAIRMVVLRMILDDPQRVNGKWSVDGWTLYCDDADYEVREYDLSERDRAKAMHMLKVAEQSHAESYSQD